MRKIIAMLIMAIFLVSILPVAAFADSDDASVESEGEMEISSDTEIDSEDSDSRRRMNRDERLEELRERRAQIAKKNILMKERFLEARAEFAAKKKLYLEQRAEIRTKIVEVKKFCQKNPDSERCSRMKKEFMEADAKQFLLRALDAIEKVLEKRQAKIEELMAEAELDAEVRASLEARLEEVEARLDRVAELRADVEAATTKEEIKQLAKLIRSEWHVIKGNLEVSSGHILANRFAFAIHRSEALENKLENTLARLKAKGYDVSVVEEDVVSFRAHITKAKEFAAQAKAEFAVGGDVKEGHRLLTQAHSELKLAHEELKVILKGLRVSAGAEADVEIETLSESEDDGDESEEEDESDEEDSNIAVEAEASASGESSEEDSSTSTDVDVSASVNLNVA